MEVEDALEAGVLRYSKRQSLLKRAAAYGIRRFDANLIIAMVQQRVQGSAARGQEDDRAAPAIQALAVFLVVQSLILAAGWWLLA